MTRITATRATQPTRNDYRKLLTSRIQIIIVPSVFHNITLASRCNCNFIRTLQKTFEKTIIRYNTTIGAQKTSRCHESSNNVLNDNHSSTAWSRRRHCNSETVEVALEMSPQIEVWSRKLAILQKTCNLLWKIKIVDLADSPRPTLLSIFHVCSMTNRIKLTN